MAKRPFARHWTSSFSKPTRFNCSADQTLPELSPSVEDKKKESEYDIVTAFFLKKNMQIRIYSPLIVQWMVTHW